MNMLNNIVLRRLIIGIIRVLIPVDIFIILLHYESALHRVKTLGSWCGHTSFIHEASIKLVLLILSVYLIAHYYVLPVFVLMNCGGTAIYVLLRWLRYVPSLGLNCWNLAGSARNEDPRRALIGNLWHVEFDVIHFFVHCRVSTAAYGLYILEYIVLVWRLHSAIVLGGSCRASSQVKDMLLLLLLLRCW